VVLAAAAHGGLLGPTGGLSSTLTLAAKTAHGIFHTGIFMEFKPASKTTQSGLLATAADANSFKLVESQKRHNRLIHPSLVAGRCRVNPIRLRQ